MFWSLLLFGGHSFRGNSVGKGALVSGQALSAPGQACGSRGCGPRYLCQVGTSVTATMWPSASCHQLLDAFSWCWKGLAPGPVSFLFLFSRVPP